MNDIQTKLRAKNGELVVCRIQDVEPYLKQNHEELASAPSWRPYGSGKKDIALRKVADVPLIVVEQWLKEGVDVFSQDPDMQKRVREKLNDYTNRKLRTYPGRL